MQRSTKTLEEMQGSLTLNEETMAHILFLPFPVQGHINPMLQFAKRIASKGLKTTLATTIYLSNTMHLNPNCKVGIETLSDGFDETGFNVLNGEIYVSTFKEVGSRTLGELIQKYNHHENYQPITCLVCDSTLPWGLDVGKQFGLVTASLYTQPCSVSSIFYQIKQGNLKVPVEEPTVSLPGLPLLALEDLPSPTVIVEPVSLGLLVGQFSNLEQADWLLFNSFEELESQALIYMRGLWPVRTIGPTAPSMYLGDAQNSLNIFKPSDVAYMEWLDGKETGSVLYIAFGSIVELGEEQMEELIWGLKKRNKSFIWVLREKEQTKLPTNFAGDMSGKGLLLPWCSQSEVLAHKAIGCFLTHCGWNSVTEALSLGVPMVAMPQVWDQITNAKFIQDVWGLGIRLKKENKGIVTREELESCLRDVMEGERGKTIRLNATRWRDLAKDAVDVGGSSDLHIDEFVANITCTKTVQQNVI